MLVGKVSIEGDPKTMMFGSNFYKHKFCFHSHHDSSRSRDNKEHLLRQCASLDEVKLKGRKWKEGCVALRRSAEKIIIIFLFH